MFHPMLANPTMRALSALYAGTFLSGAWAMIIPTIPLLAIQFDVSAGGAAEIVTRSPSVNLSGRWWREYADAGRNAFYYFRNSRQRNSRTINVATRFLTEFLKHGMRKLLFE